MTTSTNVPAFEGSTDRWENEGGPASPERPLGDDVRSGLKSCAITPARLTVSD